MKNSIKIQDYRNFIPNSAWRKKAELIDGIKATEILYLSRSKTPSEKDILNYIISEAKYSSPDKSELLSLLNNEDITKIKNKNKDLLYHLREHIKDIGVLESNIEYFFVLNGILPTQVLNDFKSLMYETKEKLLFHNILVKIGKKIRSIKIKLNNSELPLKSEMEFLLEREVTDSSVLAINGSYDKYKDVKDLVRILYNSLEPRDQMKKIGDCTKDLLIGHAALAVKKMVGCNLCKSLYKHIDETIEDLVNKIRPIDLSKISYYQPPSNN